VRESVGELCLAVVPTIDPVASVRMVKDDDELAAISRACAITAQGLGEIADGLRIGDSEVDIARRLESRFGQLGAQDRAFPTIVASGPNSAVPHHRAGSRQLAVGDLLVIDCGALVDGYHADMTRTFIVGTSAGDWQESIHAVVAAAQAAAIEALEPDCHARDIDAVARAVIDEAGFGSSFTHGTGHGVGLEIHESPMLTADSTGRAPMCSVVTVEPGIYLPGRGGVRIEDSVVVQDTVKVLTELPRALTRVG
jgi:Xaa-Pro aminopeptidase